MEEFISEDARLAVKKGANWLDNNYPNWVANIDLNALKMSECETCVVGQTIGDYSETIAKASKSEICSLDSLIWAVGNGFEQPNVLAFRTAASNLPSYNYEDLESLWTDEVKKRLG